MDGSTEEASASPVGHADEGHEPTGPSRLQNVYTDQKLIGTSKTRVVHLLPGHREEPVRCTLDTVDFQQIGQYEALSYVWGRLPAPEMISVNGIPFSVTENLFHALKHLRLDSCERVLWIDAICINQSDIDERNQQVRRMAYIYSECLRVIGWLGVETEGSRVAFKFLANSYHSPRDRRALINDPGWQALKDVYQRDYWKRVWIVQEICLARQVVFVCGNTQIPWNYITELRKRRMHCWLQYLSQGERDFMRSLLSRIDHVRETHQKKGCRLWTLFESFKESQCQEIHDRVYGFLGLASDCGNEDIPIDYSRSVSQVYQDVVRFYYGAFQKDASSPHSAQLMKFSEFFRGFLEHHSQHTISLEHEELETESPQALARETTAHRGSSIMMQISASRMMFIDKFLRYEDANKFAASELMDFLGGRIPYSHLGFWRDFIDPGLSEVYTVRTSQAFATSHIALPQVMERQEEIDRPSVFIASTRNDSGSSDRLSILGIAPPGSRAGDMLCTFVDSHITLVMRPVAVHDRRIIPGSQYEPFGNICTLIGRAYLDFQYMERLQQSKSRLTKDKSVELITSTTFASSVQDRPWPATLTIDIETLKIVTKKVKIPRESRSSGRQLELLPSTLPNTDTSCSHPSQRFIDHSELAVLHNHPWIMQYVHGPGYAGIVNLGATGYLSCVLQIMYMLMPLRSVYQTSRVVGRYADWNQKILQAELETGSASLNALHEVFQNLRTSLLPVSPENLTKAFGWTTRETFAQQGIFEFWELLLDHLVKQPGLESLHDLFLGSWIWKSGELQQEQRFRRNYIQHMCPGKH